ncbi:MAG TPA: GvpL/GvpF family gas vesicle protein [Acidimicrobiales bacterium]|nr:GvpL/GvpF family gas vesicle protein [Acidimicrobiales bacterium]
MIHLYCVVDDAAAAAESCRESGTAALVVIPAGPFACVGRTAETPPPTADPQALVDHDAVVRRLMRVCTVIPFRYGTVLGTDVEVRDQMAARADEFQSLLGRLHGKVELALRATSSPPPRRCEASGRGYLRSLRTQAGSNVLHRLHRTLEASSHAAVVVADRPCSMKTSYLVDEQSVEGFCRVLANTLSGLEDVRDASLTGPWAPYSFVNADAAGAPERATAVPGGRDV